MPDPATCPHGSLYWYAEPANERGWRCADCGFQPGEEPGYSPQHDRDLLRTKVWCIVMDLHDKEIIYVSNSDCGEALTNQVTRLCRDRQVCDSVSIARIALEIEANDRHASFWRERHVGILAGKDPRSRCACGKLAHQWCNGIAACGREHMDNALVAAGMEPW